MARPSRRSSGLRAGISLLEVLISIGILSVGLLATLSLIPAGRSYMKKAAVDDRAAALVPDAYATMTQLGLLSVNALSWTDVPDGTLDTRSLVIREVSGRDIFNYSPIGHTYNASGDPGLAPWTITATNSVIDVGYYPEQQYAIGSSMYPNSPATVTGTLPTAVVASSSTAIAITVSSTVSYNLVSGTATGTVSPGPSGSTTSGSTSGVWSYSISPQPLQVPRMEIWTSGPNLGEPKNDTIDPDTGNRHNSSARYAVKGIYTWKSGTTTLTGTSTPTPSSWLQYGLLRQYDIRKGRARITYTLPGNAYEGNESPATPTDVPMTRLENAVAQGRDTIARSVTKTVTGNLWRMELGTREGDFTRRINFANTDQAPPQPQNPVFDDKDITEDAGDTWISGPDVPEDVDWYRILVDAGDVLTISWSDPDDVLLPEQGYKYPLYLNTTSINGGPMQSIAWLDTASSRTYSIPNDGYVVTRAALKPSTNGVGDIPKFLNTFGSADTFRNARTNPSYSFTATLSRSDRVVVVDPLMASRFDKILALSPPTGPFDARYLRRHRFADFQQTYFQGGSPRAFVIPRLNWQKYAAGGVDPMVAVAEKMFHDQDNIAVDLPANSEEAPTPIFDLTAANTPARRQAEGKMSWLLMLQPEDPGPVAANWSAGKYFDVSLVIFENRKLPPLVGNPTLDGEYAFLSTWSDLDGAVTVTVPASLGLDDDDVRDLFKTGSWVLLAPRTTYEATPLDSTQRLDWVRVQTMQLEKGVGGAITATLLLDSEPADNILYRSRSPGSTTFPIVVLAYQGVVTVVNKSIPLSP